MAGEPKTVADLKDVKRASSAGLDDFEKEFEVISSYMHAWGAWAGDECLIADWRLACDDDDQDKLIEEAKAALKIDIKDTDTVLAVCQRLREKWGVHLPAALPDPDPDSDAEPDEGDN